MYGVCVYNVVQWSNGSAEAGAGVDEQRMCGASGDGL